MARRFSLFWLSFFLLPAVLSTPTAPHLPKRSNSNCAYYLCPLTDNVSGDTLVEYDSIVPGPGPPTGYYCLYGPPAVEQCENDTPGCHVCQYSSTTGVSASTDSACSTTGARCVESTTCNTYYECPDSASGYPRTDAYTYSYQGNDGIGCDYTHSGEELLCNYQAATGQPDNSPQGSLCPTRAQCHGSTKKRQQAPELEETPSPNTIYSAPPTITEDRVPDGEDLEDAFQPW